MAALWYLGLINNHETTSCYHLIACINWYAWYVQEWSSIWNRILVSGLNHLQWAVSNIEITQSWRIMKGSWAPLPTWHRILTRGAEHPQALPPIHPWLYEWYFAFSADYSRNVKSIIKMTRIFFIAQDVSEVQNQQEETDNLPSTSDEGNY